VSDTARTGGRRYGGREAAQRREERRARLIDAGLELFGTVGYAATSVKNVCREAGLTERYFYESFQDREDLLATVYDELMQSVQMAVFAASAAAGPELRAQARAGLGVFLRTLTDDVRKARIVLIEIVGVSPRLEQRRHAVMHEFADFVTGVGIRQPETMDPKQLSMTSIALVGGVNELLLDWTLGRQESSVEEIVEMCTGLVVAAFAAVARHN
jgi:AcrR family transcriptional regulator